MEEIHFIDSLAFDGRQRFGMRLKSSMLKSRISEEKPVGFDREKKEEGESREKRER